MKRSRSVHEPSVVNISQWMISFEMINHASLEIPESTSLSCSNEQRIRISLQSLTLVSPPSTLLCRSYMQANHDCRLRKDTDCCPSSKVHLRSRARRPIHGQEAPCCIFPGRISTTKSRFTEIGANTFYRWTQWHWCFSNGVS